MLPVIIQTKKKNFQINHSFVAKRSDPVNTNLYKFWGKVSPNMLHKINCCDLNLGENFCIFTFFRFSDSGLYLLNGFDFYFDLFLMA